MTRLCATRWPGSAVRYQPRPSATRPHSIVLFAPRSRAGRPFSRRPRRRMRVTRATPERRADRSTAWSGKIRTAPKVRFVETNQSDLGSPVLFAKIFRFTRRANHLYKFAPSHATRGAYRDRHGRGVRMRWTRQRLARDGIAGRVDEACERSPSERTRDVAAYGKIVWS